MVINKENHNTLGFIIVGIIVLFTSMLIATSAQADEPNPSTEEYCLGCHANPELNVTLPSEETLPLYISAELLSQSTHSPIGIECHACHSEISTYPHPDLEYNSKRELARAYYLSCKKCHTAEYDKTLDSMHAQVAADGNIDAPICTDCHGAHYVQVPDEPRAMVSETCSQCHIEIYKEYRSSIHGDALIEEDNPDVPVCTDCHGVHNIKDPRTVQFHIESPELCAGCHADQELMSKYGLSADVYDIYEISWHGVDVSVYKARWPTIWHDSAVCTDCHGVHNIRVTDDPASLVNQENLLITCQKCHPEAGPNWTDAWTGHHEISLDRTPFIFYVSYFYTSFTPFVLVLSVIYVVLQIIRHTVNRARRSLR